MAEQSFSGKIALAGNPNVGKSTLFNALTHLHQHTGNWTGKTIDCACGTVRWRKKDFCLVDLPGTYMLHSCIAEENAAREFLQSNQADCIIVVADATCLERNLIFALQVLDMTRHVVLCVNLMDEAKKKQIHIDIQRLQTELQIPVVPCTAAAGKGLDALMEAADRVAHQAQKENRDRKPEYAASSASIAGFVEKAEQIAQKTVTYDDAVPNRDRKIDQILTSRRWGIPIMLLLIAFIFFLTITGANIPSEWLAAFLFSLSEPLSNFLNWIGAPEWLRAMLVDGGWNVLASVVSVMLPPMAIFFPLFTCLEDMGYLPRIAFNLDHIFCKARACGKQVLTLCMGLGCNAAGVIGCRIMDSSRERMIGILTNAMVPCNGRFPAIISLITLFVVGSTQPNWRSFLMAALSLTGVVALGVVMTLAASWLLSKTILRGMPSAFFLELPPYRKPQIGKIIVRSLRDRTLFVLIRAICVAAPAGLLIWCVGNISVGADTLLTVLASALDPLAQWLGLDGMILLAFILGFPANEIVIPLILMGYLSAGTLVEVHQISDLGMILAQNGWTVTTAVCFILFSLFHWPCSTTCLTIRKETGSIRWMLAAMLLPTMFGVILCFLVNSVSLLL